MRGIPVTRKNLSDELGISVQNFYKGKSGAASFIAEYVESLGVLEQRAATTTPDLEATLNRLKAENEKLKKENAEMKKKNKLSQAQLKSKNEMIDALKIKVETLEGNLFQQQKIKFANSRI